VGLPRKALLSHLPQPISGLLPNSRQSVRNLVCFFLRADSVFRIYLCDYPTHRPLENRELEEEFRFKESFGWRETGSRYPLRTESPRQSQRHSLRSTGRRQHARAQSNACECSFYIGSR
jgi:hypothetical protein